jgi:hypothetical protein
VIHVKLFEGFVGDYNKELDNTTDKKDLPLLFDKYFTTIEENLIQLYDLSDSHDYDLTRYSFKFTFDIRQKYLIEFADELIRCINVIYKRLKIFPQELTAYAPGYMERLILVSYTQSQNILGSVTSEYEKWRVVIFPNNMDKFIDKINKLDAKSSSTYPSGHGFPLSFDLVYAMMNHV